MSVPYAEVIGDPITHSKSPLIHKFWLEKLGLKGDFRTFQVPAEDDHLRDYFARAVEDPDWLGCSVTAPHKRTVFPLLGRLSPEAEVIGAVNLVTWIGGELVGRNTDAQGFLEPLRPLLSRAHHARTACLFGAGGAARAAAHALVGQGFTIAVAARDKAAAEALVVELGGEHYAYSMSDFARPTGFAHWGGRESLLDLFVNATPLGMRGDGPFPLDWSHVPPEAVIYDLVYAPVETALLKAARRRGHQVIDGLAMLIGQGAVAFEVFFGRPAPRGHDAELRELLTR